MNIRKKLSDILVKVGLAETEEAKLLKQADDLMAHAKQVLTGKEMKTLVAAFNLTPGERVTILTDKTYEGKVRAAMNKLIDAGLLPTDIYIAFKREQPMIPERMR